MIELYTRRGIGKSHRFHDYVIHTESLSWIENKVISPSDDYRARDKSRIAIKFSSVSTRRKQLDINLSNAYCTARKGHICFLGEAQSLTSKRPNFFKNSTNTIRTPEMSNGLSVTALSSRSRVRNVDICYYS